MGLISRVSSRTYRKKNMDFLALEERFGPKTDCPTKEEINELTNQAKIYFKNVKNDSLESSLKQLNLSGDDSLNELSIFYGRDLALFSNFILDNIAKNIQMNEIIQYELIIDTGCKMNLSYTSGFYEKENEANNDQVNTKKIKLDLIIFKKKSGYLQISEDVPNYLINKLVEFLNENLKLSENSKIRIIENQKAANESQMFGAAPIYMYGGEGDYHNSNNSGEQSSLISVSVDSVLLARKERINLLEKQEALEKELGPDPFVKRGQIPEKYSRLGQEIVCSLQSKSDKLDIRFSQVREEACGVPDLESLDLLLQSEFPEIKAEVRQSILTKSKRRMDMNYHRIYT